MHSQLGLALLTMLQGGEGSQACLACGPQYEHVCLLPPPPQL